MKFRYEVRKQVLEDCCDDHPGCKFWSEHASFRRNYTHYETALAVCKDEFDSRPSSQWTQTASFNTLGFDDIHDKRACEWRSSSDILTIRKVPVN